MIELPLLGCIGLKSIPIFFASVTLDILILDLFGSQNRWFITHDVLNLRFLVFAFTFFGVFDFEIDIIV